MKKIILLLCLILGSVFYSFSMIDETINTENIFIKDKPKQTETVKEAFEINNFLIKPLYDYKIKGIVLKKMKINEDKKEYPISNMDIVLGWKKLSNPENIKNIDLNLNYKWFSWKNRSELSNKVVNESLSNNHIIHSDSIIKKQLSELKQGQAVIMSGYLVRVIDKDDGNWGWRSSVVRTDKGDGSDEVFYVNNIEYIK